MGILAVLYATSPGLGSTIYSQIYKLSIESSPGLAFMVGAGITMISIIFAAILHVKYNRFKAIMDSKKTNATA